MWILVLNSYAETLKPVLKDGLKCYSTKQHTQLDNALDLGVKALVNLDECRTWRDKYKEQVESFELVNDELPKIVTVERKHINKKATVLTGIGALLLGLIAGASF